MYNARGEGGVRGTHVGTWDGVRRGTWGGEGGEMGGE